MMGEIKAFPNLLLPFLDGGNLNASSIDMEAEDEAVIEAEPARPKRKHIATLQVIIGVTDPALCLCPCHLRGEDQVKWLKQGKDGLSDSLPFKMAGKAPRLLSVYFRSTALSWKMSLITLKTGCVFSPSIVARQTRMKMETRMNIL